MLDRHTVRLNLAKPVLSVAEDCAEYCALIVHPSFVAPLSHQPIGTGPFTLEELRVGERCILKRVTKTSDGRDFVYWGGDVYLDEIHFYHYEQENQTAALASGSVDAIYELTVEQLELAQSIPGAQILSVETAQTLCCRMQVDVKPFDDIRVRRAVVKAADNAAIKNLVFGAHGSVAGNFHVAPIHPEYFPLPPAARDVAGARQLLKEAGYENGLDLTIVGRQQRWPLASGGVRGAARSSSRKPGSTWRSTWCRRRSIGRYGIKCRSAPPPGRTARSAPWRSRRRIAAAPRGMKRTFRIRNSMPHCRRPRQPSMWPSARLKMQKVEKILRDAAVVVQPFWRPVFSLASARVHGYQTASGAPDSDHQGLDELSQAVHACKNSSSAACCRCC